jgi:hypothetical protein
MKNVILLSFLSLIVVRTNAQISFIPMQTFTTGTNPYYSVLKDFDGDGKLDMAVCNGGNNTVSVFRNTSIVDTIDAGSFTSKVDFATSSNPFCVASADFDGDGKQDIVTANTMAYKISILRNNCTVGVINTSSFDPKVDYATGIEPRSVDVADIDGDGKIDIAVVNQSSNSLTVFQNQCTVGVISFASGVTFSIGTFPQCVRMADLDGDGKKDIVVVNQNANTISILRNTATSGIINASSLATPVSFTTGNTPYRLALGDIDMDGKLDIAVSNFNANTVSLYLNTTSVGVINSSSFATPYTLTVGLRPIGVEISDLNGDTKPELVVVNAAATNIGVYQNNSVVGVINASTFSLATTLNAAGSIGNSTAIGDIDGDGKKDIAFPYGASSIVAVYRNNSVFNTGINNFTANENVSVFPNPFSSEIVFLSTTNETDLQLFDCVGNLLMETKFTGEYHFDGSSFVQGIYFYTLTNKSGEISKGKVIKE